MRSEHPLGIDAFVPQACQLSPHINPIQSLQLLQKCIKITPKLVGMVVTSDVLVGYGFSISDSFFKRAWANTFDFLPLYWQQHQNPTPHPRSPKSINWLLNCSGQAWSSHF